VTELEAPPPIEFMEPKSLEARLRTKRLYSKAASLRTMRQAKYSKADTDASGPFGEAH